MSRIANYIGLFKKKEQALEKRIGYIGLLEKQLDEMEKLESRIESGEYADKEYKKYLRLKRKASYYCTKAHLEQLRQGQTTSDRMAQDLEVDLNRLNFGKEIPP